MISQLGSSLKYKKTTMSSRRIVAKKKAFIPFGDLLRGRKAGRFWAPIKRLLINGDDDASASNQVEVITTMLIEAIQLAQLNTL